MCVCVSLSLQSKQKLEMNAKHESEVNSPMQQQHNNNNNNNNNNIVVYFIIRGEMGQEVAKEKDRQRGWWAIRLC